MSWSTSNSTYGSYGSSYARSRLTSSPQKRTLRLSPARNTSGPQGLHNLGNTCYISAAMQVLFEIITQIDFPVTKKSQQQLTAQFFILKKTKDRDDYKQFKRMLEERIEIVRGWQQQDAHELLIQFLEQLRKQNPEKLTSGKADLTYREAKSVEENWRIFVKEMQKLEKSKIISLFYGEIVKRYTCPYGHDKYSFERYSNLSLPFSAKSYTSSNYYTQGPLHVKNMIDTYLGQQQIDDLQCQKCKKKLRFRKRALLYTVPRYLILHLSRFLKGYYKNEKNNRQVEFDEYIKVDQGNTNKKIQYKLMGVIHHLGTLNRGHYYAQVRINDEWYEFDDEKVTPARMARYSNLSKSVYMLIYQRQS